MKKVLIILAMAFCMAQGHAQTFDRQQAKSSFDEFRKSVYSDFNNFRRKCMEDYIAFVRNPWKAFEETKPVPKPIEKDVPPVTMPKEDQSKPKKDVPVVIDEVVSVQPTVPQPKPVEPVREVPVVEAKNVTFTFFGTKGTVRFDADKRVHLNTMTETAVADALSRFTAEDFDNLLYDCLRLRRNLKLCDWAYLQMLKALSGKIAGEGTNDAELLMAWLYMQSGYKMRLAFSDDRLYMLYASRHLIYNFTSYRIDGDIYYGVQQLPARLNICQASFPKEQRLSLLLNTDQRLAEDRDKVRTIVSRQAPELEISVSVNKNLLDFYSTYPSSMLDENQMTRWAMYANTPMAEHVQEQIYPTMKAQLKGLSQEQAVGKLLNWVQTGFVYEYDDKVWGHDRAFFAEETLYYPYCDCEDRSILLTRLVRDLLGLKCILVYYPGHLASAVAFDDHVSGDYILLQGKRFVIADATYIDAPVGMTMTGMDNQTAKVILLE